MSDTTSLTYDSLLSTTLYNYRETLENNVFNGRPLLNWLTRKDRITTKDGGARIVIPIIEGSNSTAGFYSMYDAIPTTPQDGITAAEYLWAQAAVSVAIAGLEEAQNNGRAAIIDLLQSKMMQAEESFSDLLSHSLHCVTGPTGAFNGIGALVDSTGTVGGLDQASHSNWASYEEGTSGPLTLADMATAYNTITRGGSDRPDGIFTTQTLFEKYESLLQPNQRYTDVATANAGFENLTFKNCPVMWDPATAAATTGYTFDTTPMYFLNSKYIQLVRHSQKWFTNTPFKTPTNQDARYAQILAYGQLVTNCRRKLGKLTGRS